jgi:hypothetical protein
MKERSWRRSTVLTVLVLGALVLSACATRSVNQILADPARYRNREVRVSGSVVESYSLTNRGAYLIDDHRGSCGWCPIGACLARARGSPSKERSAKGSTWERWAIGLVSRRNRVGPGDDGVVTQRQELRVGAAIRPLRAAAWGGRPLLRDVPPRHRGPPLRMKASESVQSRPRRRRVTSRPQRRLFCLGQARRIGRGENERRSDARRKRTVPSC